MPDDPAPLRLIVFRVSLREITRRLSFLSDVAYAPGTRIDVVVEYLLDGHHYPLRCAAEIVRVEPSGAGYRIGARLAPDSPLADVFQNLGSVAEPEGTVRRLRPVD